MFKFYRVSFFLPLYLFVSLPVSSQEITEVQVLGVTDTSTIIIDEMLVAPADTTALLRAMPGANINKNGELTGVAQYRGMFGDRINISINGAHLSSGGPNAMDAPLHYAPVALLKSLTIQRGIAPVSSGQETIGGSIEADTYEGEFTTTSTFEMSSRLYAGAQSVNDGGVASALLILANKQHIFRGSLMQESASDARFPEGSITPSEYDRKRLDLGYSFTNEDSINGQHHFSIDFARNETGDAGTPALPMDILSIESDILRSLYRWQGQNLTITAKLSNNSIEHWMTNFHLRKPPQGNAMVAGPMLYRQTYASSDNSGFSLQFEQLAKNGLWRYGVDGHYAGHDALITNPNAGAFEIVNFNNVKRDLLGVFIEREFNLSAKLWLESGIRVNRVEMDAGDVNANLNPMSLSMGMPVMMNAMANGLAGTFNQQDRSKRDTNVDWFGRFNIETQTAFTWYLGLARKTRSPSYQERYLWLPLEATAGLADGFSYIGNIDLKPEVSHEVELGFDFNASGFTIYPRLFYKRVDDYIQGVPSSNAPANMLSLMMAQMGMGLGQPLAFDNVDAKLYGLDLESNVKLSSNINLRTIISTVKGVREDINDNLYRITPSNLSLTLDYSKNNWIVSLEAVAYSKQDKVSKANNEEVTAGFGLMNAFAKIYLKQGLDLGFGINNIFDRNHKDHLAGYNRATNPDIGQRERLPGLGRNVYGRLIWNF